MHADTDAKRSTSQMSSAIRTFRVLEEVSRLQPVSLAELSQVFDYSKSTLQRTLKTLEAAGWLVRNGSDSTMWEVSTRALLVRPQALTGGELLARAQGPMTWLRDQVDETIHLTALNDLDSMVLIHRVDCQQVVRTFSPIGDRSPLHATSTGKAVLAYLPERDVEDVLARSPQRYNAHTVADREGLMRQLREIRRVGYAINDREYRAAVSAIGAPVFDASGAPIAGLCISMPSSRYEASQSKRLGRLVRQAADQISVGS